MRAGAGLTTLALPQLGRREWRQVNGRPNIVLVHGAWADGSCWSGVIERLQAEGFQVRAPQFPLSSLADDVARLRQVLEFQDGPTIVVGHSYGGQIITALGADAPNVVGLVYIAAFGLDEGESLGALLSQGPVTPALAHLFTDSRGFGWLSEDDFVNHFAADVDPTRARVLYAVQQPLASSAFTDVMGVPAWKSLPSWYLVAQNDEAIPPDAERQFAARMGATTVEIPSSHVAMVSHPAEVADLDREGGRRDRRGGRALTGHDRKGDDNGSHRATSHGTPTLRRNESRPSNGIEYAYRDLGDGEVPLVLLQHFRGNLDNWDPRSSTRSPRIDAWSRSTTSASAPRPARRRTPSRRWPTTPSPSSRRWTFSEVDLLGFSIGSFVAQEIALIRPDLLRRVVLASAAPQGAAGMHGWAPEVIGAVGAPETTPQGYLDVFFAPTDTSREAGQASRRAHLRRRTTDRDEPTTWQTRQAQYDAVCAWGIPNHSLLQRVAAIDLPVFVANGDSDPMILPRYSYLLAGLLPDARLTIYPDSAHGFLFQHHSEFAADVNAFLAEDG